jgi:SAM-dependent methyltransferase
VNPYALLARYYDLENAGLIDDLDFWLELAGEHGGPILELGCGTGRVLLPLARRGYSVTGVDNSPEMLARLDAKLAAAQKMQAGRPAAPTVIQADLAEFSAAGPFQLALMPFSTFMHLLTPQAQAAALANIRRHLAPGAPLVLDMINPADAYAAHEQGVTLERTFADGGRTVQVFSSLALDRAGQLGHITWIYDSVGPAGDVQRLVVPLTMRYTFPGELRWLLEKCGFALEHLYGDYDRSPFVDGAPRLLALARAV